MGTRKQKTASQRRTKFGMALEESAKEILAHVKSETGLPTRRIVLPEEVKLKRIRSGQLGFAPSYQRGFARRFSQVSRASRSSAVLAGFSWATLVVSSGPDSRFRRIRGRMRLRFCLSGSSATRISFQGPRGLGGEQPPPGLAALQAGQLAPRDEPVRLICFFHGIAGRGVQKGRCLFAGKPPGAVPADGSSW